MPARWPTPVRRRPRPSRQPATGAWRMRVGAACAAMLPVDRALLGGVDLLLLAILEQEGFHVPQEERAGLRVHEIQPVMVDEHGLLAEPVSPADRADLTLDPRADRARKGSGVEAGASLPTARACDVGHRLSSGSATERTAQARAYFTSASPRNCSTRMYTQPMSNSYQRAAKRAECGSAWWLLCNSSPPSQMAIGEMLRLSSFTLKFR